MFRRFLFSFRGVSRCVVFFLSFALKSCFGFSRFSVFLGGSIIGGTRGGEGVYFFLV